MAFNAKNLSYDRQEPAFLRRLKGQHVGDADRQERPTARPKRLKNDDEDDGPTYVVEDSGDTLSKEEYAALVAGEDAGEVEAERKKDVDAHADAKAASGEEQKDDSRSAPKSKQKVAEIGAASRKRKAVKVGGGADHDEDEEEEDAAEDPATNKKEKATKKPKKKAKAVKLSFGDEEENT